MANRSMAQNYFDFVTINPYSKFHFSKRNLCEENERKLQRYGFFSKPMGNNPVEICSIVPQIKLHLDIVRMNV